jgi:hypothetical protein
VREGARGEGGGHSSGILSVGILAFLHMCCFTHTYNVHSVLVGEVVLENSHCFIYMGVHRDVCIDIAINWTV